MMLAGIAIVIGLTMVVGLVWIDMRQLRLPDWMNAVLGAAGVAFGVATGWVVVTPMEVLFGAMIYCGAMLGLRSAFWRIRGRQGLGLGDVKLVGAAACWLGVYGLPLMLAGGAFATLVGSMVVEGVRWLHGGGDRRSARSVWAVRVPLGPGLCVGLVVAEAMLLSGF